MTLIDIASLIVFVAGTVLHAVLFWQVLRRPHKRPSELLMMFLGLAAAMWFLGNALSSLWAVVFRGADPALSTVSLLICCLGIGFVPSLLMHMALQFFVEQGLSLRRWLRWLVIGLSYVPAIAFSYALVDLLSGEQRFIQIGTTLAGKCFIGWLSLALAVSAGIALKQSGRAEDNYERRFHLFLFGGLILLAGAITGVNLVLAPQKLSAMTQQISEVLDLVINAASLLPAIVFSYYVYRYNIMEFVLRRSLLHGFVTILVIALYYYGIRRFGQLIGRWTGGSGLRVNVPLVEAVLIIALVYLFPRLTELVRRLIVMVAFRQMANTEGILAGLNRRIGSQVALDTAGLLRETADTVRQATGARHVTILLFPGRNPGIALPPVTTSRRTASVRAPVSGLAGTDAIRSVAVAQNVRFLDRHECKDVACAGEMRELNAEWVFPIRSHNEILGLMCLGRTPGGFPLDTEVCDLLVQTAAALSAALEHARTIQERIRLELNMLESEKFSSLGRLSASIAHEVKNPLNSIKMLAQVLQEEADPDRSHRGDLQIIIGEVDRLARVVNQLLRFARPPSHPSTSCQIDSVLDMVLQVVRPEAEATHIELSCRVAQDLPPVAMAEDSLKEVLFNLIYNAIQAMPQGGRVVIEAGRSGDALEVTIADTGPGIPAELRSKIFEPFFTTKVSGTGLGLSIVRRRVAEVGGEVALAPAESGTRFCLRLPLAAAPPAAEPAGERYAE